MKPTIILYDDDEKRLIEPDNRVPPLLSEDKELLVRWREKARRRYARYNGGWSKEDEKYLIDPNPFEAKWYIFRVKPMRTTPRSTPGPTPRPSPQLPPLPATPFITPQQSPRISFMPMPRAVIQTSLFRLE